MRWLRRGALGLTLVVLVLLVLWTRGSPRRTEATSESMSDEPSRADRPGPRRDFRFDRDEWKSPASSPEELATPGGTPPLKNPATDADGHLLVHVAAGEAPPPAARIRVYLRGPRDPASGDALWRFAGGGAADARGELRIATRPGTYLVVVRSPGYAVARREVLRPTGEPLTEVRVALSTASVLRGVTLETGGDQPVPLAELALSRTTIAGSGLLDAPAEETVYATSDPRGVFSIDGLEEGSYRLEAAAPGHARVLRTVFVPRSEPLRIELLGASTLEGRVVFADGSPAANAEVAISGFEATVRTTTGEGGGFATEVNPGRYTIRARASAKAGTLTGVAAAAGATVRGLVIRLGASGRIDGVVVARATQQPVAGARIALSPFLGRGGLGSAVSGPDGAFSLSSLAAAAYDVEVDAEGYSPFAERGVTIAPGRSFPLRIELDGPGVIVGAVHDPSGAPVSGALVEASVMWVVSAFPWGSTHQARTGADGTFQFEGIEAGQVRVRAGRSGELWLAQAVVEVRPGEEARADLSWKESGVLEGRVTRADGAPLGREVNVLASARTGALALNEQRSAAVSGDGRYRLELPANSYQVRAMPADPPVRNAQPPIIVTVEPNTTIERDLLIDDSDSAVLVDGLVVEPDGSPSASAMLRVSVAASGRMVRMLAAGPEGRFSVPRGPGSAQEPLEVVARNGGRLGIARNVSPGAKDVRIVLRPAGAISGTVDGVDPGQSFQVRVDALDAAALPNMAIGEQQFAGGAFSFDNIPPGRVRVSVTTRTGQTGAAETAVDSGQTAQLSVRVEAATEVSGRVVVDGKPVAGAGVQLDGRPVVAATGPDGIFRFDAAPGAHTLAAWAPGFAVLERSITVGRDSLALGDLALTGALAPPARLAEASWTAQKRRF